MPRDILRRDCKCPKHLIEYFGRTLFVLRPRDIRNDKLYEGNTSLYRKAYPWYMYLPMFVMNRVPSDLYRFQNHTFEIAKNKQGVRYVKQKAIAKKQLKKTKKQNQADNADANDPANQEDLVDIDDVEFEEVQPNEGEEGAEDF